MTPQILQLDVNGQPIDWINWQDAVTYEAKGLVAWSMGEAEFSFRGGNSRLTGEQSVIKTSSIIAVRGTSKKKRKHREVALTNYDLFRRDCHICAYCGKRFSDGNLSRDHVHPTSRGGEDIWMNVVTSCKSCNNKKDNMTLAEAGMDLLYVPYVPTFAEHLIFKGRNVLADQMDFLMAFVPATSRLHQH